MNKEDIFRNKSIKDKVNGTFYLIIGLYLASVLFACVMLVVMRLLPNEYELAFLLATIVKLVMLFRTIPLPPRKHQLQVRNYPQRQIP